MYYCIVLIILTGIVVLLSKKSSMLRNEIFNEDNFCKLALAKKIKDPRPAFSLGRTQLAFWTVIVMSSFVYAFIKSLGEDPEAFKVPELTQASLALLGIAAGTTLVSKVIDTSQKENQGEAISQQDYPSKGFLIDIVSDEKGVSIHRLQNVIWTVIVGIIYIVYVTTKQALPDMDTITPNLFALMGISTSAYLGLKLNENKNAPVPQTYENTDPDAGGDRAGNGIVPPPPPLPQPDIEALADGGDSTEPELETPPAPEAPSDDKNQ